MNTKAKGDALELSIYDFFRTEVDEGRFFARPECARVFRQKGYYSKEREGDIVFDVSIEVYRPGAEDYAFLYLVECKNYRASVGVGEVEEFAMKVRQVGAAGAKGVLVSRSSFQEGAVTFARSNRMGLLRYFDPSDLQWVLERSPSSLSRWAPAGSEWVEIERALTEESYVSRYFDFHGAAGETYSNNVNAVLSALLDREGEEAILLSAVRNGGARELAQVRFVSDAEIAGRVDDVLGAVGYEGGATPLEPVCAWQRDEIGLSVVSAPGAGGSEGPDAPLGRIRFDPPEIVIYDTESQNRHRQRFTLAHELGHLLLGHGGYLRAETVTESDLVRIGGPALAPPAIRRMEVQANRFASYLLMPERPFTLDALYLAESLGMRNKGFGLIYLDDQEGNRRSYYALSDHLVARYNVSRSAVKLRLEGLGLLKDARGGKRLGSLLSFG